VTIVTIINVAVEWLALTSNLVTESVHRGWNFASFPVSPGKSRNHILDMTIILGISWGDEQLLAFLEERSFMVLVSRTSIRCTWNCKLQWFFFLWRYSPNLGLGLPPWNSPFHFGLLDLRHLVGHIGRVISSPQGLYLYTTVVITLLKTQRLFVCTLITNL
jgi:hypothetical protein